METGVNYTPLPYLEAREGRSMKKILLISMACAASACSSGGAPDGGNGASANIAAAGEAPVDGNKVATSGKSEVPLAQVPAEVLAAAAAARPA